LVDKFHLNFLKLFNIHQLITKLWELHFDLKIKLERKEKVIDRLYISFNNYMKTNQRIRIFDRWDIKDIRIE
jgi:MoaA/NifB/PqqE/SkfB family radical SAM enzyme